MKSGRVEAFSDGVIAILITIMVLELPKPHDATWEALQEDVPVLLAYVLSFVYLGIYWNAHHHVFQLVSSVRGGVLWANLNLLFWLSLVPFTTAWMSEQNFHTVPVIVYGVVLLIVGLAYYVLRQTLIHVQPKDGRLLRAIGRDIKGRVSFGLYVVGVLSALVSPIIALVFYGVVAVMWLVPDRGMEQQALVSDDVGGLNPQVGE